MPGTETCSSWKVLRDKHCKKSLDTHNKPLSNTPEFMSRRTNHVIRGLELSAPLPTTLTSRGWRLNQSLVANDLISHAYTIKTPLKKMFLRIGFGELPGW